jgi:hypothetical protein
MSGGYYEYLCNKSVDELLNHDSLLQRMADDLAELGYADDAARETMDVLLEVRRFRNRMEARLNRIGDVWHAMEWWQSLDSSEECLKEELTKYRGGKA